MPIQVINKCEGRRHFQTWKFSKNVFPCPPFSGSYWKMCSPKTKKKTWDPGSREPTHRKEAKGVGG